MAYDMRLLHIIGSMDPLSGGPCEGIRSSSPALEKLDVYREVVCFDSPDAAYVGTDSFPVHPLGKGKSLWQYNHKLIPWLRENLHRFDVVVTNGLWLYHSNAVRRILVEIEKDKSNKYGNKKWFKWFIMPHGMLDPYFQQASSRKLKAVRNWFYWKLLEHKVVSQADGLLFTCETELLLAREAFKPYRPKREINVGYGIESPPIYSALMRQAFLENCPSVTDEPYLLFLSRIHPKKGIDLLLKAYINFSQQTTNNNILIPKLVIAGPGIDTNFGRYLRQIANQDVTICPNIHFTGMLTGDEKWGAFYGCEAFILPSHQENFGIAVAEALACRKPVLISNQVNIWREIETGEGGFITENTIEGVQLLFEKWMKLTLKQKKEMGKNAYNLFREHFSIEQVAIKLKNTISD